ncbi:MAG: FtsX-like permease family protein [Terriglobia bacterium]|jgi:putative ABC transport system permease protein
MWRLVLKNLLRNKRRSFLTGSSVAVSLFLLSALAMVYTALGAPLRNADNIPIMMVRRSAGIIFPLPLSHGPKIRAIPGVVACASLSWFGGYWKDPANQFANFAVDAEHVFEVQMASTIPPDQKEAFIRDRTGAVAGRRLAERFGWKVGDRITLLGSPYGVTPELTLRGIYSGGPDDQLWFHWEYMNESIGRMNMVGLYWVRLEKPEMASRVGQAIDQMFRNTDNETKTESLSAFLLSFIAMLGNVRLIILMIGSAVTFAILLVVTNTMAMSIRERFAEAAVMRSLGYRPAHIVGLFMAESIALTMLGALVGIGGAKLLFDAIALSQLGQFVFADMRLRPETLVLCFSIALGISLLAVSLPAYRAAKGNIAMALRFVG